MGIRFVNARDAEAVEREKNSFDFLLSTVPGSYDPLFYVDMLKAGGQMAVVGQPAATDEASISMMSLPVHQHRYVYGSFIGSLETQQEMIDFCVANDIYPDVELIPTTPEALDRVYDDLEHNRGAFRYIMKMCTLK